MNLREIGDLNNERFLKAAFEPAHNPRLTRAALIHRNIYLVLSIAGFICIFSAIFADRMLLSILSLFLSTLSLVVMTKYDTQVFFLRIIRQEQEEKGPPEA